LQSSWKRTKIYASKRGGFGEYPKPPLFLFKNFFYTEEKNCDIVEKSEIL